MTGALNVNPTTDLNDAHVGIARHVASQIDALGAKHPFAGSIRD